MPYYNYEARNKEGKLTSGQAFAINKQEIVKILQREDLLILDVNESASIEETHRRKAHKKARTSDLVLFSKEMAILLENGVPMIEAFDVIAKQLESIALTAIVKQIKSDVEGGGSFRDAVAKHQKLFGTFWQDMIEAGEISGQLPYVMRQISTFLSSREDLRKKTVNAFLYPALLFTLAIFTILVFVFKVVPIFEELFSSFNAKLPAFTGAIVTISYVVRQYFPVVAVSLGAFGFIVKRAIATKPGRRFYENVLFKIPVLGDLLISLSIEKFASTLGVLLRSGIPILKALEVSVKSAQSQVFAERIEEAKVKIMGGLALSEALQHTGLFPPLAVQLVIVGEKTGNFAGMMDEISKYYNDIIDTTVTRFTTLLGPVVLLFMALVIGSIIVAMFLPIFKFASLG